MKHKGFTLTEVLVGIVVIAIISLASFTTISLLTRSTETSRNTIIATNLMQKSMEEVRRVAQSNFDDLETCAFPVAGPTGDACGFQQIQADFPGFTRTLSITNEHATSEELKRVQVTVDWNDMGTARQLKSVILLSRPPDPLPGNIRGIVHKEGEPATLIPNAEVTIQRVAGPEQEKAFSTAVLDAEGNNYDFKAPVSGQFILDAGNWTMQVERSGYEDYTHPTPIYVTPGGPAVEVDVPMTPLPEPATITYQLVDRASQASLGSYSYYSWVRLRKGNTSYGKQRSDPHHSFTINFPSPTDPSFEDPLCLTLHTDNAYRSMRAYKVNSLGPVSCTYDYNAEGWSSAYVADDGSLTCANPHYGDTDNDRICVSPGDNVNVSVPLDPVPTVTVTGRVTGLAPNRTGRVYVYWPRREGRPYYRRVDTDATGHFQVQVPAAQSLWGNSDPSQDYMFLRPYGPVSYQGCCESPRTTNRYGSYIEVGPLYEGDPPHDAGALSLPSYPDSTCGNVEGEIRNAKTGAHIDNADVTLRGSHEATIAGQYLYACPVAGYRLPVGNDQRFEVDHPQYYEFRSDGNVHYADRPGAAITADTLTQYNAAVWPIGRGTVQVTVVDKSTTGPIENVVVNLNQYDGNTQSGTTDANGIVMFNQVLETWPPAALPAGDPNYNYTARHHTVTAASVSAGNYILPESETVTQLDAGGTANVTISLIPEGAM
jgi:prepilin-type N-terminal cleavage/methylation domain-containing protein